MENTLKTHDEIPGMKFVTNVAMMDTWHKRYEFLATENDAIKYIRDSSFNNIPLDEFCALRNPYQRSTWSVYVDAKHEAQITAWTDSIKQMLELLKQMSDMEKD